jgi:hypothetical protein
MEGFGAFMTMAFWIAIAGIPLAICGLAFLHAARVPQWTWVFSGRTQIWWLAGLLVGIGVMPIGLPAAIWYLLKVRPELDGIERGDVSDQL